MDDLSLIKGLFTRCGKFDQWDWFTVWQQLGRPTPFDSFSTSRMLYRLRDAIRTTDNLEIARCAALLDRMGCTDRLEAFPAERHELQPGSGYIYIMSNREMNAFLKVGFTQRSVEQRAREINAGTGMLIPLGVRAVWVVRDARSVESEIHTLLDRYRVRRDREFFNLDFKLARRIIEDYVRTTRRQL